MTPILIAGPAVEPVGLPELRAYLRLDDGAEDDFLSALVKAARLHIETASGRVLLDSRWRIVLDAWPDDRIVRLPVSPLIAVEQVSVIGSDGTVTDLSTDLFDADVLTDPPRIVVDPRAPEPGRPRQGIAIEVRAGYGATAESVPAPLRQDVRLLVVRWFENRGDADPGLLPPDILALVSPFRRMRV